jgi:acetylornithine deacetylase/succinyl-diaminopimelate desuccinylase-like protein
MTHRHALTALATGALSLALLVQPVATLAQSQLDPEITRLAQAETPAVLDTLKRLTAVDTGTTQAPGLLAVADMIEAFVKPLGGEVRRVTPAANVPGQNLVVSFRGTGTRKVMLMAHMDTVYPAGVAAARPFRIDGNRAIAPGIADAKGGVANILHAVRVLHTRGVKNYERLTLLFNVDEERGSVGSRDLIRATAAEHDVVFSAEPTGTNPESIVLATSGAARFAVRVRTGGPFAAAGDKPIEELADAILRSLDAQAKVPHTRMNWTIARAEDPNSLARLGAGAFKTATLTFRITGKASHAGVAPELGVNAVVEMAHLVARVSAAAAQASGIPAGGAQLQWRAASGGLISNVIPDRAQAVAEIAVPTTADIDAVARLLMAAGERASLANARVVAEHRPGLATELTGAGEAYATADMRLPDIPSYGLLEQAAKALVLQKKFASSSVTGEGGGMPFPPFNANEAGIRLAELARSMYAQLGGQITLVPRTFGGTDAVWAAQSGKPVLETMGLPGGNYHSSDEEFVLIDRIGRRVNLLAELIRSQLQ